MEAVGESEMLRFKFQCFMYCLNRVLVEYHGQLIQRDDMQS